MTTYRGTISGAGQFTDALGDSFSLTLALGETIRGGVGIDGTLTGDLDLLGNVHIFYDYVDGYSGSYDLPLDFHGPVVTNIHDFSQQLGSNIGTELGILISGSADPTGHMITLDVAVSVPPSYGFTGSFNLHGVVNAYGGTIGLLPGTIIHPLPPTGVVPYDFTITRGGDVSGPDSVAWAVAGVSTTPASARDFAGLVLPSGTVTLAAFETSKVVSVYVTRSAAIVPKKLFTVNLSDPSIGAVVSVSGAAGGEISDPSILPPGQVKISGVGLDSVTLQFADTVQAAPALGAAEMLNRQISDGLRTPFAFTSGLSIPTLPGGIAGHLVMHGAGTVVMPLGYTALATDSPAPVTAIGGPLPGQIVLAGSGGLAFNASLGAGSVIAAGGNNLISVYPGAGSQFIQTGAGDDTIIALSGDETISAGPGHNQILTGAGHLLIHSRGADLIAAGDIGHVTIDGGANDPTIFLGPGQALFTGGTGHATVVAGVGTDTLNTAGGTQIWLGGGSTFVNSTGADTVIGGGGSATVNASAGNAFIFAGTGSLAFNGGAGVTTILGNASGSASLQGGGGSVIALSYAATQFTGGSGADTIAGFGGSLTVHGGSGAGLFLGGPAGHNLLVGGSGQSILLGGGGSDTLIAGSGAGDVLLAGPGAETLTGAGTAGAHRLYAGPGANVLIAGSGNTQFLGGTGAATMVAGTGLNLFAFASGNAGSITIEGFNPALDYLSLVGFAPGAVATVLAGSTNAGGSQSLTLSDGTHITLYGFVGLTAGNFL